MPHDFRRHLLSELAGGGRPLSQWRAAAVFLASAGTAEGEQAEHLPSTHALCTLIHTMLQSNVEAHQQAAARAFKALIRCSSHEASNTAENEVVPDWMTAAETRHIFAWCWDSSKSEQAAAEVQSSAAAALGSCIPYISWTDTGTDRVTCELMNVIGMLQQRQGMAAILSNLFSLVLEPSACHTDAWQGALEAIYLISSMLKLTSPFTQLGIIPRPTQVLTANKMQQVLLALKSFEAVLAKQPNNSSRRQQFPQTASEIAAFELMVQLYRLACCRSTHQEAADVAVEAGHHLLYVILSVDKAKEACTSFDRRVYLGNMCREMNPDGEESLSNSAPVQVETIWCLYIPDLPDGLDKLVDKLEEWAAITEHYRGRLYKLSSSFFSLFK